MIDLFTKVVKHNKVEYLTITCKNKYIPMVLVDNGSFANICPLRMARKLGIRKVDINLLTQGL